MKNYIALFFTGIGIGIFLGLSKSPILLQILVPLLTIIVGLLAILTGQKGFEKPEKEGKEYSLLKLSNINVFPIMWMVLGMVAGSALGILAREYQVLSPNSTTMSEQIEVSKEGVYGTILHNDDVDECEGYQLCKFEGIELISKLKNVRNPELKLLLKKNELNLDSIKFKINEICNCKK
jgi:hypothetical protein